MRGSKRTKVGAVGHRPWANPAGRLALSHPRWSLRYRVSLSATAFSPAAFCCLLLAVYCLLVPQAARAQGAAVVDRIVAIINGKEIITYSDLLWQMALQPDTPIENPRPEDVQSALQRVIDQRLVAQEAEKLPLSAPTDEEVTKALEELIARFPSRARFEQRTDRVGLTQEQLRAIVQRRVVIRKYIDFRFGAFAYVSPAEVESYYRDVFVPRLRQSSPGSIIPTLDEVRDRLERRLRLDKIQSDIDAFLEDERERADIVYLN